MSQNIFENLTADPVEQNMKHLKVQLFSTVTSLVRQNGWNQTETARILNVSSPRVSNLFKGHLEEFSIDALIEMTVRIGYAIDVGFCPENQKSPISINFEKRS